MNVAPPPGGVARVFVENRVQVILHVICRDETLKKPENKVAKTSFGPSLTVFGPNHEEVGAGVPQRAPAVVGEPADVAVRPCLVEHVAGALVQAADGGAGHVVGHAGDDGEDEEGPDRGVVAGLLQEVRQLVRVAVEGCGEKKKDRSERRVKGKLKYYGSQQDCQTERYDHAEKKKKILYNSVKEKREKSNESEILQQYAN